MNIDTLTGYYQSLLVGESTTCRRLFANSDPLINTPLHGQIKGVHAFERYAKEQQEWLYDHNASTDLINLIQTPDSVVVELVLNISLRGEDIDLPVALKADLEKGEMVALRIYHSTWPFDGKHQVRGPLIDPAEGLQEPEVIQKYMQGLATGDPDLVLSLFDDEGYAREPSGGSYRYQGPEELAKFYGMLSKGPIVLHHCSITFDGKAAAIEYICDEWADTKLPPQAGIAVYELAGQDKLIAARIYDDVEPPFAED